MEGTARKGARTGQMKKFSSGDIIFFMAFALRESGSLIKGYAFGVDFYASSGCCCWISLLKPSLYVYTYVRLLCWDSR